MLNIQDTSRQGFRALSSRLKRMCINHVTKYSKTVVKSFIIVITYMLNTHVYVNIIWTGKY
jgi:hypothetical protein